MDCCFRSPSDHTTYCSAPSATPQHVVEKACPWPGPKVSREAWFTAYARVNAGADCAFIINAYREGRWPVETVVVAIKGIARRVACEAAGGRA